MRIVIVSQYFRPEVSIMPSGLADELAANGHSVRVITGYPNYPEGKIFDGFRQKLRSVQIDGEVAVRRVPLIINHSSRALFRVANYLSFSISSLLAFGFARKADVVYVYATPMTVAIAPLIWSKCMGLPFVLHVQDLWPESVTGSSLVKGRFVQSVLRHCMSGWLRSTYLAAAAVIAIAPTMKKMLEERGACSSKTHVVLNWADEQRVSPRRAPHQRRLVTVTYAGTLGYFQDLEVAVTAAASVTDLEGFRLMIVGSGAAEKSLRKLAQNSPNVHFRGRVPSSEMSSIYDESDFQLVTLKDLPIFSGTIPSKLQGSFAAGVPVIATVAGDVNKIVTEARAGLTAPPGDAEALAAVFRRVCSLSAEERQTMGENGRKVYDATMSQRTGARIIEGILANAARNRS